MIKSFSPTPFLSPLLPSHSPDTIFQGANLVIHALHITSLKLSVPVNLFSLLRTFLCEHHFVSIAVLNSPITIISPNCPTKVPARDHFHTVPGTFSLRIPSVLCTDSFYNHTFRQKHTTLLLPKISHTYHLADIHYKSYSIHIYHQADTLVQILCIKYIPPR